jgi:hypothetical protein
MFQSLLPEDSTAYLLQYIALTRLHEKNIAVSFAKHVHKLDANVHLSFASAYKYLADVYADALKVKDWTKTDVKVSKADADGTTVVAMTKNGNEKYGVSGKMLCYLLSYYLIVDFREFSAFSLLYSFPLNLSFHSLYISPLTLCSFAHSILFSSRLNLYLFLHLPLYLFFYRTYTSTHTFLPLPLPDFQYRMV